MMAYCECGCGESVKLGNRFVHTHHNRVALHSDVFTAEWAKSEAGAWFLGLWTADGCLTKDSTLSISMADAVKQAADAIGAPERAVTLAWRRDGRDRTRLSVGVAPLRRRLAALGITPGAKTGRERAPNLLVLNRHFWRGVVDGDGWISLGRSDVVGLCGANPNFVDQFAAFVRCSLGFDLNRNVSPAGRHGRRIPLYRVDCAGERAYELACLLYEDAEYAMKRKADRANAVMNRWPARQEKMRSRVERRALAVRLYLEGFSAGEIQKRHGINTKCVYRWLKAAGVPTRKTGIRMHQTHCKRGHPLSGGNLRIEKNGARRCLVCSREQGRRRYLKRREAAARPSGSLP